MEKILFSKLLILYMICSESAAQSFWDITNCQGCDPCPKEKCNRERCECFLTIEHRLTMMFEEAKSAVKAENGRLYQVIGNKPVTKDADIITADGQTSRILIAVNRQFPGPAIKAFEGQTLVINVRNLMHTDSTTVHWHGQHQKGTPYVDGVAFVTQCPILPGHTFTYCFKAGPLGSSFYHAHIGDQRSMGLYGPLIVYKKDYNETTEPIKDHIVSLQDWNHDDEPETLYQRMLHGVFNINSNDIFSTTESVDGAKFSRFQFHSGIINGKGRYYLSNTDTGHNGAPLEVFHVQKNRTYRFRVIGAATLYPFRVYVDGHPTIKVVATDGFEMEPIEVESFIIQPGERIDFLLDTDQSPGMYLLVAESIEVDIDKKNEYHAAEAIIQYEGSGEEFPNPRRNQKRVCQQTCKVFNCPYLYYRPEDKRECLTYNDARNNDVASTNGLHKVIGGKVKQKFFNFAFPGYPGDTPGSVNGRQFIPPIQPPLLKLGENSFPCDNKCAINRTCECSHYEDLEYDSVYQFVISNIGNGTGWSHPIHLHGHSFYVIKLGFGEYNQATAKYIKDTPDLNCTHEFCTEPFWADPSWGGDKLGANTNLAKPIQKDTIVVPVGGYVVIRFRADNPGVWFFHCHIDLHNTNGMGMMLNESQSKFPSKPPEIPSCAQFFRDTYVSRATYNSILDLSTNEDDLISEMRIIDYSTWMFAVAVITGFLTKLNSM